MSVYKIIEVKIFENGGRKLIDINKDGRCVGIFKNQEEAIEELYRLKNDDALITYAGFWQKLKNTFFDARYEIKRENKHFFYIKISNF